MTPQPSVPQVSPLAAASNEERINWIRQERWINYTRAREIMKRICTLLSYPPRSRMPCLLVYGDPGMGKTTIIQKVLRDYGTADDSQIGFSPRPLVGIQMPPEPVGKDFYHEILRAMGSVGIQSTGFSPMERVRGIAKQTGLRVLVIDEIHNMLAGTFRQQRIMLHALRFLANDLQLALVCVGTEEAKNALQTDQQLQDRFDAVRLPRWKEGAELAQLLKAFATQLPLREASPLWEPTFRKRILELTDGITVRMCRVIESAAISAIENGVERIDLEMLNEELISPSLLSLSQRTRRR
jgi:replication-associated recombination protein RarA